MWRGSSTPDAAVRVVAPRLLLLCLLLRSSWLTVESGRQIGGAGVLHRRGGRAAVAVSVGVAGGVPKQSSQHLSIDAVRLLVRHGGARRRAPCAETYSSSVSRASRAREDFP
jgi:hypothetical protein